MAKVRKILPELTIVIAIGVIVVVVYYCGMFIWYMWVDETARGPRDDQGRGVVTLVAIFIGAALLLYLAAWIGDFES